MSPADDRPRDDRRHPASFRTTRWSVVRAAAGRDSAAATAALATLCDVYWYPVYAFIRRSGGDAEQARDLTQDFFTRLLEKRDLGSADPERGRFRSYLLGSVRHFLSNVRDRARAAKRGGGRPPLSIDFDEADRRYALEPVDPYTPEKLFFRQWALAFLGSATNRLAEEYGSQGKRVLFERLRPALVGEKLRSSRRELAEDLGMSETAINVTIHRMRRRFRQVLKEEVAQTLAGPEDAEDELRQLLAALSDE
jgi:RNA polymerase sigma-70 factor (ECF subfamily)